MKKWKRKDIPDSLLDLVDHLKGFVLAAIVIVAILGAMVGYRYYRYTQDEPQYCASCHMMKEAFLEWQKGKHRDVVCQQCHHLSMIEQNQLLVAFVVSGNNRPFSQTHGREKPWKACKKCHMDEMSQAAILLNKSYGHVKHIFMEKIDCNVCHQGTVHDFHPDENACKKCHQNKGVHGMGMEAFSCLKCHLFSENTPSIIPNDKCIKCHNDIPQKGIMAGLLCQQCHKPHGKIKSASSTCAINCHRNEASVGQHGFHLKKGLNCTDCHEPHSWIIGDKKAATLCSKCHFYKDPSLFIY